MPRRFDRWRSPLLAACAMACMSAPVSAQPLMIAAASDLQGVLPRIVEHFEQQARHPVRVTFGSSGQFFAQIQNGAPFDLFLSADVDYPRRLEQSGLAEPGSIRGYGIGSLVLWARRDRALDLASRGLRVLADRTVQRIAIANPEHAPYGRAAVAALRSAGLLELVRRKLVIGENVSQAAQFVQSGNADVGIVALSIALTPALALQGTHVRVPPELYPAVEQAGVIVRAARDKQAAGAFLAFMARPDVVALLEQAGIGALPPTRQR